MFGLTQIVVSLVCVGIPISVSVLGQSPNVIPILVYHRFDPQKSGPTTVKTATFEAQLAWLSAHHYRVVPLQSVVAMVRSGSFPESPVVAITVDDGHRSVYTEMFSIIRRHGIPVTLFIYPSAISNADYALTWDQLRELKSSGLVDIQSHTYWHPDFRKEKAQRSASDYQEFVLSQLARSKDALERRFGGEVNLLAWPFGIIDADLKKAALHTGYRAAFAYEGGPAHPGADLFAIPRIPVSDWQQGAQFGALLHPLTKKVAP